MYRTVLTLLAVSAAVVSAVMSVLVGAPPQAGASAESDDEVPAGCASNWVAAWNASPVAAPGGPVATRPGVGRRSLRMIVRPTAAGSEIRLLLSNRYGTEPLELRSVSVARSGGGAALDGEPVPVTFDRLSTGRVPPRAVLVSDPVPLAVSPASTLAVSMYLPGRPAVVSEHPWAMRTSYLSDPGDVAAATDGSRFTHPTDSWLVLTGVDVRAPRATNAVVLMGDSITDGVGSSRDAERRLSDDLSGRLSALGGAGRMAVLNAGIAGNHLLTDAPARAGGSGESVLTRLGWEVAGRPGVTDVILHAGTNDLADGADAPAVVAGLVRFAERAHDAGLRVYLTTITPAASGRHGAPRAVAARSAVNDWIRARGREHAEGVFDFAAAVTDVSRPTRLLTGFDAGDGLHLSDTGYRVLAGAVDPRALSGSRCLD